MINWGEFSREHKRVLLSGALALGIILVGFFTHERDALMKFGSASFARKEQVREIPLTMATSTDMTSRDSDGDGLPDWEEHIYGSDPLIPDTDKDSTSDGQEIREGRDPSVPNTAKKNKEPNDKLKVLQDPHFATSSTDILGLKKEFFAKFLATQGQNIRATTYRDLIKGFDAKKFVARNQLVDLNISSNNDTEALRAYGNTFGTFIIKYTERTHRTEQEILADGMKTDDDVILRELQLPAISYKNFSLDLKSTQVPSGLAQSHLLIVNGYDEMSKGLLGMQVMHSNPIDGAAGYQAYTKGRLDVTQGYAGVVLYFRTKNVIFTKEEPGYPFYEVILKAAALSTSSPITTE
jgi:hypothetical protein